MIAVKGVKYPSFGSVLTFLLENVVDMALDFMTTPRVFLDTHIFTLFKFLEEPDSFIPGEESGEVCFIATLPVVREVENIKDTAFSTNGQKRRAKKLLEILEDGGQDGSQLSARSYLVFRQEVSNDRQLEYFGLSQPRTPDDFFVAAVHAGTASEAIRHYVVSDDVGVRLRAKLLDRKIVVIKPSADLRFAQERDCDVPNHIQRLIRELGREVADSLRIGLP